MELKNLLGTFAILSCPHGRSIANYRKIIALQYFSVRVVAFVKSRCLAVVDFIHADGQGLQQQTVYTCLGAVTCTNHGQRISSMRVIARTSSAFALSSSRILSRPLDQSFCDVRRSLASFFKSFSCLSAAEYFACRCHTVNIHWEQRKRWRHM